MKTKFPKTIIVTRHNEGEEGEYLCVNEKYDDVILSNGETIKAGLYQLVGEEKLECYAQRVTTSPPLKVRRTR